MADTEPVVHFVRTRPPREQEFVNGVPARDLTLAEWDALPEERREAALASGRYRLPAEVATPTEAEPSAAPGKDQGK